VYFAVCINGITINSGQMLDSFRNTIYYFSEFNVVEDLDGICERTLSQPIYNPGPEYAEDEDFEQERTACFIFDNTGKLVEQHANALDCRPYCCDHYNYGAWPISIHDSTIEIDELEPFV